MRKLTEDDKKNIYDFLAESYIDLVAKGVIGKLERRVLSAKILTNIEKATSFDEVHAFITNMVKTYPFFADAATRVKGQIEKFQEQKVIGQLSSYIKNFDMQKTS